MRIKIIKKLLKIFYLIQKIVLIDVFHCCAIGYITDVIYYYSKVAAFIIGLFLCMGFMYSGSRRVLDKFSIITTVNVILYCLIIDIIIYKFQPYLIGSYIMIYAVGLLIGLLQSTTTKEELYKK